MPSSELAISVRNLTKAYTIAHQAEGHATLAETILDRVRHPFRRQPTETFQALKGVSFDVREGQIVGIIGRNGAGKSTLLKVLSRITEPTGGEIEIHGRVGSLLEVGTGFHPELTGRENIYLNGRILGMRKREIDRQFDAIVDFAEIDKFLDTPVKRYSSGMYVRLAFAVAAHLEPEILIIDEVLAVGDVSFQKKCLGKIGEVGKTGRTVLFVSHTMQTVLNLCERAILMDRGTVVADGDPVNVTREYLARGAERAAERIWRNPAAAPGDKVARLHAVRARDSMGTVAETFDVSEPFEVEVQYWNLQHELKPTVSIHFYNEDGILLFVCNDFANDEWWETARSPGLVTARVTVPAYLLSEGRVSVLAAVCTYDPDAIHALERDAIIFQVVDRYDVDRTREKYGKGWPGAVRPRLKWQITTDREAEPADTAADSALNPRDAAQAPVSATPR